SVVEGYAYGPYGTVTILSASFTVLSSSAYAWVYLNQGSRLDFVTGLYHHGGYGGRDEDPNLMRWIEEDPLRTGVAPWYGDEGNNPLNGLDPSGMQPPPGGQMRVPPPIAMRPGGRPLPTPSFNPTTDSGLFAEATRKKNEELRLATPERIVLEKDNRPISPNQSPNKHDYPGAQRIEPGQLYFPPGT